MPALIRSIRSPDTCAMALFSDNFPFSSESPDSEPTAQPTAQPTEAVAAPVEQVERSVGAPPADSSVFGNEWPFGPRETPAMTHAEVAPASPAAAVPSAAERPAPAWWNEPVAPAP